MASVALDYGALTDLELAKRIAQRDTLAVRLVTSRNNQRLYRTAWSVLRNRADAEDAVQDGYLKAFAAIGSFAGASSLSTWLTRIVLNEALGRRRSAQRRLSQLRAQAVDWFMHSHARAPAWSLFKSSKTTLTHPVRRQSLQKVSCESTATSIPNGRKTYGDDKTHRAQDSAHCSQDGTEGGAHCPQDRTQGDAR